MFLRTLQASHLLVAEVIDDAETFVDIHFATADVVVAGFHAVYLSDILSIP